MVLTARARLRKNTVSASMYLNIPSIVVKDSSFPFNMDGEYVIIKITGPNTMQIEKEKEVKRK